MTASRVSITDVGTLPAPPPTALVPTWTMSSACYDINESGEAACLSTATGPTYRCGFRPNVINAAGAIGGVRYVSYMPLLWVDPETDLVVVGASGQVTGLNDAGVR